MSTSWEKSSDWYGNLVGEKGHYYHQKVIFPALKKLLPLKSGDSLLDMGAGQGIFAKIAPESIEYVGIDLSPSLIKQAKAKAKKGQSFLVADATKKLDIPSDHFDYALANLSLQNMERPDLAIKNIGRHLKKGGTAALVLNHPCFRAPRLTSWGVDPGNNIQYRRVNSYLSPQKIPIEMQPGKKDKKSTWTTHFPLSYWFDAAKNADLVVTDLQELCSDKMSTGKQAKRENRARAEFPLFMILLLRRL